MLELEAIAKAIKQRLQTVFHHSLLYVVRLRGLL